MEAQLTPDAPRSSGDLANDGDLIAFPGTRDASEKTYHRRWLLRAHHSRPAWLDLADGQTVKLGGRNRDVLCFSTFTDLEAFAAAHLGVTDGWTVDRFGGWVPVGDHRASTPAALEPCHEWSCGFPARKDTMGLCTRHSAEAVRVALAAAKQQADVDAKRKQSEKRTASDRAALAWARRLAAEFALQARPSRDGSGDVIVNGEGLYALLSQVLADAGWILEELPPELQLRPPAGGRSSA